MNITGIVVVLLVFIAIINLLFKLISILFKAAKKIIPRDAQDQVKETLNQTLHGVDYRV
ncbi:MAG: hypothetical protein HQK77_18330, partial [Desulfobacterales bacterium]|nr:hypothetical protein [Desulfobacterales bacterium]